MTVSTSYSYSERKIFDIKTFLEGIRFIICHTILAFILLFLTLEEIEWTFFAYREESNDIIIDNTSWNIKEIFEVY
ncbi:hypothetical protein DNJ73_00480 [Prochlorococcus marinus XMU1408]|uniref:Uncharacterized protein n=1 Tax=Prochlorococcus marinus XMU1408 TaxID=2213228 RepID=A0A318R5Q0_PROMR|nr:hypothetical protein [Prochlorococcus marinus str. XMU1408]PYE03699.1 hypothetical protein DNJ73_00480 [Prochlorococcus marinus XMU1408]